MGRPRKRQFIETVREEQASNPNQNIDLDSLPFIADELDSYNEAAVAEPYYTNGQSAFGLPPETTQQGRTSKPNDGGSIWHFGDRDMMAGPSINFGDIDFGPADGPVPTLDSAPALTAI